MAKESDSDKPFRVEYAKSGRSACKKCQRIIGQDELRLAVMAQSYQFDGRTPMWYHFKCFWPRTKVEDANDIDGLNAIRWEDQKKIKDAISSINDATISGNAVATTSGKAGGKEKATHADFMTEYAKSGGSTCRGCDEKIAKDEVRIASKDWDSQRAQIYGPQKLWHHVDCFVKNRDEVGFTAEMKPSTMPGFSTLSKEDKDMIIEKLGKGAAKKRKAPKSKQPAKKAKQRKRTSRRAST